MVLETYSETWTLGPCGFRPFLFEEAEDVMARLQIMRALRLARIFRLLKLFRRIRALRELQKLVTMMAAWPMGATAFTAEQEGQISRWTQAS